MLDLTEMQSEIQKIFIEELPKFYTFANLKKQYVYSNEPPIEYIHIGMACSDKEINHVKYQYPQYCSLSLNSKGVLQPVTIGGSGGRRIDLIPNKEDPKEAYLSIKGHTLPFRTPKPEKEAILRAIRKFCREYKLALSINFDRLMHKDAICMYNKKGIDYNYLLS